MKSTSPLSRFFCIVLAALAFATHAARANTAPVVSAGADFGGSTSAQVLLPGSATDDALPVGSSLSFQWTQVSGPSAAIFTSTTVAQPRVNMPMAGTYVFRLTASDGALSASDEVSVFAYPTTGVFVGLLRTEDNTTLALKVTVADAGRFTARIRAAAFNAQFRGTLDVNKRWSHSGVPGASVEFTTDGRLRFHYVRDSIPYTIFADRIVLPGRQPVAFSGSYSATMAPAFRDTAFPFGAGWGRINIRPSGRYIIIATLPDGRAWTDSGVAPVSGDILIFRPMKSGDVLSGGITFSANTTTGEIVWRRPTRRTVPAIDKALLVDAAPYSNPRKDRDPILQSLQPYFATVTLEDATGQPFLTREILVSGKRKPRIMGGNGTRLLLQNAGSVTGSVKQSGARIKVSAGIRQDIPGAVGFWLSDTSGGVVRVIPNP